jgi:hypothetical protein
MAYDRNLFCNEAMGSGLPAARPARAMMLHRRKKHTVKLRTIVR